MSTTSPPTDPAPHAGSAGEVPERSDRLAAAWQDLSVRFHRIQCALDRELQQRHRLTASEFELLELLWGATDHSLRMSELAGRVHLTQSALSRVVGRLEKDEFVVRSMCADDRRAVFATLTEAGAQRYCEARPTQRDTLATLCEGCPEVLGANTSAVCDN